MTSTQTLNVAQLAESNLNTRALNVQRLADAKLTDAAKRSLARLSDAFKAVFNANNKSEMSDWVAYKLSVCSSSRQSEFYALFLKNNRRITTADIDAVNRHANARTSLTFADAVAQIETLKQSDARIVYRQRKSDVIETVAAVSKIDAVSEARATDAALIERMQRDLQNAAALYETEVARLSAERDNALALATAERVALSQKQNARKQKSVAAVTVA